jgi:hypothetical protein
MQEEAKKEEEAEKTLPHLPEEAKLSYVDQKLLSPTYHTDQGERGESQRQEAPAFVLTR